MASNVGTDVSQFVVGLREVVQKYAPYSSESTLVVLNSTPLILVSSASLKNLAFVVAARKFGVNDICHSVSARANYVEVVLVTTATTVHNFAMGIFYLAMVVGTMGLSYNLNFNCKKHWAHLIHSVAAFGIGVSGVISPSVAVFFNYHLIAATIRSLRFNYRSDLQSFEAPLIEGLKKHFANFRETIYRFVESSVSADKFATQLEPSLNYIFAQIKRAKTVEELWGLFKEIANYYPIIDPEIREENLSTRQVEESESPAVRDAYPDNYANL